jgi:hypothetical protein
MMLVSTGGSYSLKSKRAYPIKNMSYMSNKSYTTNTKQFVSEFNFANPRWDKVPADIATLPADGLSKQEEHLFEAIKLAYFTLEGGRKVVIQKAVRTGAISLIVIVISLISLIALTSFSSGEKLAKPVNAATVSAQLKTGSLKAGEIFQSTVSGILKGKQ